MNLQDLWVISPALAVVTIALIVMMADIAIKNRRVVLYVTILLLLIPLALQVVLWLDDGASVVGFGGTISADKFALFAQMLITVTLILILGGSSHYVEKLDEYRGEYLALTLFSVAGMLLLVAARELITMYVAFELTAIPLAVLIVLLRSRASIEAGVKFLILSALGSALMLFGIVLIFAYSGSTHFVTIGQSLATIGSIGLPGVLALAVGMIMVVAGLGFKMSIAPWQMWVPDVYRGAPLPVSVFLSTASKTSAFVALASLTYIAFAGTELGNEWSLILAFSAVASMTVGNLGALRQSNLKRLLAYSTIAQAGYMLVGLAAITTEGETALLGNGAGALVLYLVSYTVTNIAVFMSILHFQQSARAERLRGVARDRAQQPVLGDDHHDRCVVADRNPGYVGFHRQVDHLRRGSLGQPVVAGHNRRFELGVGGLLLYADTEDDVPGGAGRDAAETAFQPGPDRGGYSMYRSRDRDRHNAVRHRRLRQRGGP